MPSNMIRKNWNEFVACFCPMCGRPASKRRWYRKEAGYWENDIKDTENHLIKLLPCGHRIWFLPERNNG